MPHAHVYGRLAKMPGVTSTFTFRPAELSPRIRESAKKMVRERLLRGGWSSKARKVAKLVLNNAHVPYSQSKWKGVETSESDERLRQQLKELVAADHAAYTLSGADNSYRNERADRQLLENLSRLYRMSFYVDFHDKDFQRRAEDAVAEFNMSRNNLANEGAQRVCALLDEPYAQIEVTPNLID